MTAPDEIHSTDKLLELIRTPGSNAAHPEQTPFQSSRGSKGGSSLLDAFRLQKKYTIGVDIGHTYIRLAKVQRMADKSHELIDYSEIRLDRQVDLKESQILDQLKTALDAMCDDRGAYDIWSAIPSAKVETRYLRIPKLPRNQIANAVYWTFTKSVEFNQQKEILDYEILGDITEEGVQKTEIMAFKTPSKDVSELKQAFEKIGYPLTGISIAPFAIQNLFRGGIVLQEHQDICCLFVGRDWSRIAIYQRGNLVLSRGIKAGMRSMVEAIDIALHGQDQWNENNAMPLAMEGETAQRRSTTVDPQTQKMFFDFIGLQDKKNAAGAEQPSIDPSRVFQMVQPAMERLIRQVERTFAHYVLKFQREGVRHIYLSGSITGNKSLVSYISRQLDLPVEVMNPFTPGSPFVRPVNIPDSEADRESFVPAIGLALSDNRMTPNTLFTHIDKDRAEDVRKINMRVLTGCMICLLVLIALFSWQERRLDDKRTTVETLNEKLLTFNPPAEKEILLALYAKTKNKQKTFLDIVQRYEPVAVISEISHITPSNVRLISVNFRRLPSEDAKSTTDTRRIRIEGIVFGTANGLESSLTGYMLTLKNSPMFVKPSIKEKSLEYYSDQEVLHFVAELSVL